MMPDTADKHWFRVEPLIVSAGTAAEITITPLFDHARFDRSAQYRVKHTPMEDIGENGSFRERKSPEWRFVDGAIRITAVLSGEQEHSFLIEEARPGGRVRIGEFRVYSVEADLLARRPFKGDLHIHTNRSDGREAPGYVAASCRRIGLDFMAVTDHRRYEPSIEAQEAFSDLPIDLRIFRGEEVHPPDNPIHIVNFGGSSSVNALFATPAYRREVAEIDAALGELPRGLDRYFYASSLWCFRAIREAGGLGIFCHPYWVSGERYHIPGALAGRIFEDQPYDAYELIGGYLPHELESNHLQALRYREETAAGRRIPVVGVSDAHGCDRGELFGWYYTLVLSPSTELTDLIDSIKECYSVAVEHLPGTAPRAHGPLRMAKYAQFLLRELFPRHDRICREEGEAMLDHLAGDSGAAARLSELSGRAPLYLDSCGFR